ncbi:OSJNBa0042P21.16 [Oryza sativa (japonica cultivar-group)]
MRGSHIYSSDAVVATTRAAEGMAAQRYCETDCDSLRSVVPARHEPGGVPSCAHPKHESHLASSGCSGNVEGVCEPDLRICRVREWLNKYCMWKEVDEKDFGFEIGAFD